MKMSTLVAPQALDKVLSLSKITDIDVVTLLAIRDMHSEVWRMHCGHPIGNIGPVRQTACSEHNNAEDVT